MDIQKPLISIITPVYNRADCIGRCMESVQAQTGDFSAEHVIVDDGSADTTFEVMKNFVPVRHPVKTQRLDRNRGTNAARNAAVRAASGRYVMLLDSDDVLVPGALDKVAKALARYPDSRHLIFTVSDRTAQAAEAGLSEGDTRLYSFRDFLEGRVHGDYTHVLLRDTMLRHPYDEEVRIHEGVFCLSFYKDADTVRFINTVLQDIDRGRNDRVSYDVVPDNARTLRTHVRALDIMCERFADDFMATPEGREILARHLLKKHRFTTMLGERDNAADAARALAAIGMRPPLMWRALSTLALGPAFFSVARFYIKLRTALVKLR